MAQTRQTRTTHTIVIDLEDHVLGAVEVGDEVEVILRSRGGDTRPKKLTWGDIDRLLSDGAGFPTRKVR
jgi:hypothetical protein